MKCIPLHSILHSSGMPSMVRTFEEDERIKNKGSLKIQYKGLGITWTEKRKEAMKEPKNGKNSKSNEL